MKIYCINLERSTDRRVFQEDQARRLGLSLEFVSAVDYRSLPESELIDAAQYWTRPIVGKDVGCFRSHRLAWERIAAANEAAIVMEDDVVLSTSFPSLLAALAERPFPRNRIYDLEYAPRKHVLQKSPIWSYGHFNARKLFINKNGAGCYALRPEVAQRLLAKAQPYVMVDSWMWTRPWIDQVQIEPCPAAQILDLEETPSRIDHATSGLEAIEYAQNSWFRKKWIRLLLTANQLPALLQSLWSGDRRMLSIRQDDFHKP